MAVSRRWTALGLPVAILTVLAALTVSISAPAVSAQGDDGPHPAHIHQGTCDELGDIVFPLDNVSFFEAATISGLEGAVPVKVSDTEIDQPLADIIDGGHSINIHRSADAIQDYIACGEIGGPVRADQLVIGLREINDSGHSGVAILLGTEAGTTVTVYLIEGEVAAEEPAPTDATDDEDQATAEPAEDEATAAPAEDETTVESEEEAAEAEDAAEDEEAVEEDEGVAEDEAAAATAEPADDAADEEDEAAGAGAPAGAEVAVSIVNFAYDPNPVEVAVGDSITWTNQDGVPHTATAADREVLQSGAISPGASFSQTFETAGEFEYFCEFHPNMVGTIVVS